PLGARAGRPRRAWRLRRPGERSQFAAVGQHSSRIAGLGGARSGGRGLCGGFGKPAMILTYRLLPAPLSLSLAWVHTPYRTEFTSRPQRDNSYCWKRRKEVIGKS